MRTGPRVLRAVMSCSVSPQTTRFGNPDHYHFQLECGHERVSMYGASERIAVMLLNLFDAGKVPMPAIMGSAG